MNKVKIATILGSILTLVGLALLSVQLMRNHRASIVVAPPAATTTSQQTQNGPGVISGQPVHLSIDSLHISLVVISGYYNQANKTWTLTTDKAQYATITPQPNNQGGNTFIYGHYRSEVFASLHKIQPGATAVITTDNGHQFTYQFASSRVTNPNDASLFYYKGAPILTLQTCTGLFFQNRQLFTFNLIKAV